MLIIFVSCKEKQKLGSVDSANKKTFNLSPIIIESSLTPVSAGRELMLKIKADPDYAVQISEYNQLFLHWGQNKKKIELTGMARSDKPDYYQEIKLLKFPVGQEKVVRLVGKLLYCNLLKNYCSKRKINIKF